MPDPDVGGRRTVERTIGIAVGIPQPWGAELDAARASTGDPQAALIPAHVTLLGPTVLPASAELDRKIDRLLRKVAAANEPFAVQLRGTGTFRPVNQVVFVALAAGIAECERLADSIRTGPLRRELAHPYHPHVTVGHDVPGAALDDVFERMADYSARFVVDHFTRYEHTGTGRWEPIRDYRLRTR
ncbi:2'-5' RNA ligase family protein [Catellatospora sp. TT07R-123]|uniref:2'-5' RNA ligase family protein n=1 Tax=Catellatospora sp. TT07R-123 TaxID=2733863 RepID=UPI001BB431EC|nr:2'-5' RNA ligase family protein [Catellatospora sp. TT07R-123]